MSFEERAEKLREERESLRLQKINLTIERGLRERTYEESLFALYSGLTFVGGISDLVARERAEYGKELVF